MPKKGYKLTPEHKAAIAAGVRGKPKSESCKLKLSALRKGWGHSQETREKLSLSHTGKVLPENVKRKISISNKGKRLGIKHTPVALSKMSLAGARNVADGKTGYKMSKRFSYTSNLGQHCSFRSSWELGVAKYLDSLGYVWYYELDILELFGECYLPDFFIFEGGHCVEIIEVKGYLPDNVRLKLSRFKESLPIPLEIWDESKLTELGILQEVKQHVELTSSGKNLKQ